jgi:hypothetical protein
VTSSARRHRPIDPFADAHTEGEETMFADRAYSRGLVASPDRLASLLYFAAAVPTVGFIHGAADLSPLNAAALEGYAEDRFIIRGLRVNTASRRSSAAG